MRRGMILICCMLMCCCVGCSNTKQEGNVDAEIQDIDVASCLAGDNAFDDKGFYHIMGHDMKYVGEDGQIQALYQVDQASILVCALYHQGVLYTAINSGSVQNGVSLETNKIGRWNAETKKMESVVEQKMADDEWTSTIFSMAAAGNFLYYVVDSATNEKIEVDGNEYYAQTSAVYRVDLTTGKQEEIYEIEPNDEHFSNLLVMVDGDYQDTDSITLMNRYSPKMSPGESYTDFYTLDLSKNKIKKIEDVKFDFTVDMACQYQNRIYYSDETGENKEFNYIDLETKEITSVFDMDGYGYLYQDYISLWSSGEDPRNYLYSYKDGKLYVSKESLAKSARVVGVGDKYLAIDERNYTNVTEQTEDIGIYKAVDKTSYIAEYYTEYHGESADGLTYYGPEGKKISESEK